MKTEDRYGSQHHHENVERLDWSCEDHEISMKTVRIFNVLSSFVSIRSRCHSNGWKRQFHWRCRDYHRTSTISNLGRKRSVGEFFFEVPSEALEEMMGDSIVGDCDWLKWFVSCLGITGLIWSMDYSQMMCLWLCDVNGSLWGKKKWICLGWNGCCVGTGAGDCPSERRATHLFQPNWCSLLFQTG